MPEGYVAMDEIASEPAANTQQQLRRRGQTTAAVSGSSTYNGGGGKKKKQWGKNGYTEDGADNAVAEPKPSQQDRSSGGAVGAAPSSTTAAAPAGGGDSNSHHSNNQNSDPSFNRYNGGARARAATTAVNGHHGHGHGHGHGKHGRNPASRNSLSDLLSCTNTNDAGDDRTLDAPLIHDGNDGPSRAPLLQNYDDGASAGSSFAAADGTTAAGGASSSSHSAGRRRGRSVSGGSGDASGAAAAENSGQPPSKARELADKIREGTWTVTAELLDALPNKVAGKLVPNIPGGCLDRLHDMQEALMAPFDHENPAHQRLIPALWRALSRVRPPLPVAGTMDEITWKGELWKDYGFQGTDPATDFRALGLLGLRSVAWMAAEEPDITTAMLDAGYPFAIAVINVVMALLNVLRMTHGRRSCLETTIDTVSYTAQEARMRLAVIIGDWRCACATNALPPPPPGPVYGTEAIAALEDGLMNVVAEACRVLHGEWLKSKRNVMEFNLILKVAMVRFEKFLRDKETYANVSRAIDKKYPDAPMSCSGI